MKKSKTSAPHIAIRVIIVMVLACLILDGAIFWMMSVAAERVPDTTQAPATASGAADWAIHLHGMASTFRPYVVPGSIVFFFIIGLVMWVSLRSAVKRAMSVAPAAKPVSRPANQAQVEKETKDMHKRYFLHLFSILQREGRLMDFFSEDLSQYGDDQIGAAVRSIQEDCKKTIAKYLAPRPVLDQAEGEQITVPEGFDPNKLKLTGNVIGQPPFSAIVRHRGWRADKLELPTLSGRQEPGLIAAAEVEVV